MLYHVHTRHNSQLSGGVSCGASLVKSVSKYDTSVSEPMLGLNSGVICNDTHDLLSIYLVVLCGQTAISPPLFIMTSLVSEIGCGEVPQVELYFSTKFSGFDIIGY